MASVITDVKTVDISLIDNQGYLMTLKLDRPKDGLTKAQINDAFSKGFGILYNQRGNPIVSIGKVVMSHSQKYEVGGAVYYVTPNKIEGSYATSQSETLTITGANVEYATVVNVNNQGQENNRVNLSVNNNIITVEFIKGGSAANYSATIIIGIGNNTTISVPVNVSLI